MLQIASMPFTRVAICKYVQGQEITLLCITAYHYMGKFNIKFMNTVILNTMTSCFNTVMESQTSDEGTTSTVLEGGQHGDLSPMRTEMRAKSLADVGQINPDIQQQCKYSLSTLLYDVHSLFWSLLHIRNFTANEY